MSEEEEKAQKRKETVKNWLKNSQNLILVGILVFVFAVNLYYFLQTANQTLWWDEAEYMSTVKHWAIGVPYEVNFQRPPLFQLLGAILFKIGFSELALKFLLVFLPNIILAYLIYLLGCGMYSKRVGLFIALTSSLVWSILFWASRFQPDYFSLCFQVLGVIYLWRIKNSGSNKDAVLAGLFIALGFYFKISALLIPISFFVYIFICDRQKIFINKKYWIAGISFVISLIPFFIWQYVSFGSPIAFAPSYASSEARAGRELGWMALNYYYQFPKSIFFVLFSLGIIFFLYNFILRFDLFINKKDNSQNNDLFSFVILLVSACFYIFFTKGFIEDRWILIIVPFIMIFASQSFYLIRDYLSNKFGKYLGILLIIIILILYSYSQLYHTSQLINQKKDSYMPVKEASELIKEYTNSQESVLSVSFTQTTAYSERKVYTYAKMDIFNFTKLISEKRPSYIIVSILEPHHPEWIIRQGTTNDGKLAIIMDYFNSSIFILNNQIVSYDIKTTIDKGDYKFDRVYPREQFNGLFVYKITYK